MLDRIYTDNTAHHLRLKTDCKVSAIDAAMATAAAPTFLNPHVTENEIEFLDGDGWANNPIRRAGERARAISTAEVRGN
ncbi:hypothetical protein JQ557_01325 [Bradyrhizobium sp. U87765 SZCCT0131]|uniref:hypothetical protein n=1 Tax=unclassified Bradyrhizobium TaxID=2631580 RepID=UPI001BA58D12|nr:MULTISPECIES: hypothetical protein [unclassified Bradyrhizobium]MBR1216615.1 hypothetical protein [Bradyrhizobium sp. U87765 SZCCT0131]MBR1259629.1 hypothetical protein [Bradyrhizobium sp. U87765 SZCCT0134]MBR1305770.1 hypothetical protein [Bradyrhizobium sp. U87765 SZCCT0110]MBR1322137.1 hypothetical protein [Bradyrhizobium sp. U87765 SZCCT0109]MBR1350585.1 hypothetical protein [Bradyrhizobium sp. U87765 SZCCT0048]